MYTIKTKSSFDSAHFLAGYSGKCRNIHGHRWTVEIEVGDMKLEEAGKIREMVVDFSDLKNDLREKTEELDHCLIMENGTLKEETLKALHAENFKIVELPFRPTAEKLAEYFYNYMQNKGYKVIRVSVYETPNNIATYTKDI